MSPASPDATSCPSASTRRSPMWLAGTPTAGDALGIIRGARIGLVAGFEHAEQLEHYARRGAPPGADGLDRRRSATAHHDVQTLEIAPREIGLLQDAGERRRRGRDVSDPLALDQVERRRRPETIKQHRLGAGEDRLHERKIAPV